MLLPFALSLEIILHFTAHLFTLYIRLLSAAAMFVIVYGGTFLQRFNK
jgi:hypothetical protein